MNRVFQFMTPQLHKLSAHYNGRHAFSLNKLNQIIFHFQHFHGNQVRWGSKVSLPQSKIRNTKIFLDDSVFDVMGSKTNIQSFQRLQETDCGWKCLRIDHKNISSKPPVNTSHPWLSCHSDECLQLNSASGCGFFSLPSTEVFIFLGLGWGWVLNTIDL